MTSKRMHLVLLVLLGFMFVGLVAGAYYINKLLTQRGNTLVTAKAQSLALQQQQVSFQKAKDDIVSYSDLEKITRTVVPEDKNQAEAVREIVKIANANDIRLGSITFPSSNLGSTASKPTQTTPKPATPSPAGTDKTAALSQLLAVPTIPGVYQLTIAVQSDTENPVPYTKFIAFLSDLEQNRRTAQVSTIAITPELTNRSLLTFNLTINVYIKP